MEAELYETSEPPEEAIAGRASTENKWFFGLNRVSFVYFRGS